MAIKPIEGLEAVRQALREFSDEHWDGRDCIPGANVYIGDADYLAINVYSPTKRHELFITYDGEMDESWSAAHVLNRSIPEN